MQKTNMIKELQAILPAGKFIVTGTYALAMYGLYDFDKVKDLDILLWNPKEEAKSLALNLMETFPAKLKENYVGNPLFSSFYYQGTKVDIFIVQNIEPNIIIDDIAYATISHIVDAKIAIGREKDWVLLQKIAFSIFNKRKYLDYLKRY